MSKATDKVIDVLDEGKISVEALFYLSKMKKFDISFEMMKAMLCRGRRKDFVEVVKSLKSSENKESFINDVYKLGCDHNIGGYVLIGGCVPGKFDINLFESIVNIEKDCNYNNLVGLNDNTKKVLRDNFIKYLDNNIRLRNCFYDSNDNNVRDYTSNLDDNMIMDLYDKVLNGESVNRDIRRVVYYYVINTCGIYGNELINNDMDFVLYDIIHKKYGVSLEDRKKEYDNYSGLEKDQVDKVINASKLLDNLKNIKSVDVSDLVNRLESIIDNLKDNIDILEDIYSDYEIILREDIVSSLYVPSEDVVMVDDFRKMNTQLLHMFMRDPYKFKKNIEENIIKDIISKRSDNDTQRPLSQDEQEEFERRMVSADAKLDPTQVNYSFYVPDSVYTDSSGLSRYHSDTCNQISASVYSDHYFIDKGVPGMLGIGFNNETLNPEAIVLSSDRYVTSNVGVNNLEYNQAYSFNFERSSLNDLIKNDGNSEVIMYRRGMDFDTKAGYVFVTIDSSNMNNTVALEKAREYSLKNNLKLVIYDLYKIRESYNMFLESENVAKEETVGFSNNM